MKFILKSSLFFLGILILLSSFENKKEASKEIVIENRLNIDRKNEVVGLIIKELKNLKLTNVNENLAVKDQRGNQLITQIVDNDLDGNPDELLFQVTIPALTKMSYTVFIDKNTNSQQQLSNYSTYARFVPERTDDFAWENDQVAFRTYGPIAQQLAEEKKPSGTFSSGIDIWLKKVKYFIIDSWYTKNVTIPKYYHIDHGEGYDPNYVGKSRGLGETVIWLNDSFYTSKNFSKYKIIATGALRTIFQLEYEPWSTFGVRETKRISIYLGSNFTKFENTIYVSAKIPNYTLGITLHKEKGTATINAEKGIFRHWEPIDDSFEGEGIVLYKAGAIRI